MNNDPTRRTTESEKQCVIRIFISSIFRDIMREWDHLVKDGNSNRKEPHCEHMLFNNAI
jgi:hypothetical protein